MNFPVELGEISRLLVARGREQEELFQRATSGRRFVFGDQAFVRGVVEISNYCRKDCNYCAMRCSNRSLKRYRVTNACVMAAARRIHECSISTIMLQGGEDLQADGILDEVIPAIKHELGLVVILNVGERNRERLEAFRRLGVDAYIMKYETSDANLYDRSTRSSLQNRMQNLRWLKELGYVLSTGNIVGLPGQTPESIVNDALLSCELNPDWVSTAPFIPSVGTPWEGHPAGNIETTLNTIAIYRIMFPHALIPSVSSLNLVQPGGQLRGFEAGANVITINFTPQHLRSHYPIYSKDRFVVSIEHANEVLSKAGLVHSRLPNLQASARKHHCA
jgi:biotin synthase